MAKRGETKNVILDAATAVFFEYGFEASSVKMIIEKAGVVTGSFYHFFPSKELLFEAVVERYLQEYSLRISKIFEDETLGLYEIMDKFIGELIIHTEKKKDMSPEAIMTIKQKMFDYLHKFILIGTK